MTTKVTTVPFRMSFPTLPPMEPRKNELSGKLQYGVTLLLPPGTDLAPMNAALLQAVIDKHGPEQKKWPKMKATAKTIFKDFDEYNSEVAKTALPGDWAGWTMVRTTANPTYPPEVFHNARDAQGSLLKVTNPAEIYGGRWARAVLNAFFFDVPGNSGVSFGLQSVQLLKHDTSFAGNRSSANDFTDESIPAHLRDAEGPKHTESESDAAQSGW